MGHALRPAIAQGDEAQDFPGPGGGVPLHALPAVCPPDPPGVEPQGLGEEHHIRPAVPNRLVQAGPVRARQDEVVADPLGQKELQGGAEGLRILRHQAHGQAAAFVAAPHPLVQPGEEVFGNFFLRVPPDRVAGPHGLFQGHKSASVSAD